MFNFSSDKWPGLAKLAEEAGEVIQVIGKLMQTQGKEEHWDGTNLRERLIQEMADLQAACRVVELFNFTHVELGRLKDRQIEKTKLFLAWHEGRGSVNG